MFLKRSQEKGVAGSYQVPATQTAWEQNQAAAADPPGSLAADHRCPGTRFLMETVRQTRGERTGSWEAEAGDGNSITRKVKWGLCLALHTKGAGDFQII